MYKYLYEYMIWFSLVNTLDRKLLAFSENSKIMSKMFFTILHSYHWCICFLWKNLFKSFYVLDTSSLLDILFASSFCHFVLCLYILLTVFCRVDILNFNEIKKYFTNFFSYVVSLSFIV